ncbi:hypothetical protein CFOL_v3_14475 [Cephalotus follicularis]|uniref:Uncharacterized protein n=1 Tax=Cephalotus follicularis TaxID=3775 RepID=A0A1Q3BSM9_CEPFO|nr:hypothetical protein CFOL_v3_14475 [Cephalotus follicularis]
MCNKCRLISLYNIGMMEATLRLRFSPPEATTLRIIASLKIHMLKLFHCSSIPPFSLLILWFIFDSLSISLPILLLSRSQALFLSKTSLSRFRFKNKRAFELSLEDISQLELVRMAR